MVPERKRKLLSTERETLICRSLSEGVKTISELSNELRVSEATVRRDLETLEANGKLRRVHGGAELLRQHQEPVYEEKASRNAAEKAYIAEKAVSFIKESDTIFLDGGSTVLELAKMLERFHDLTVVTNSLMAASALMERNFRLILVDEGHAVSQANLSRAGRETQYNILAVSVSERLDSGRRYREYGAQINAGLAVDAVAAVQPSVIVPEAS